MYTMIVVVAPMVASRVVAALERAIIGLFLAPICQPYQDGVWQRL
jgi:hypothetical protein